ncbi:MAG: hypothetical protein ABW190_10230, partial [Rhizobacter sp.]
MSSLLSAVKGPALSVLLALVAHLSFSAGAHAAALDSPTETAATLAAPVELTPDARHVWQWALD